MVKAWMRSIFVATALFLSVDAAQALEAQPYSQKAFDAAQAAGKPIVISIWAAWCPVQDPILYSLIKKPGFDDVVVLEIEFDRQKDLVRQFGARMQSTLIAFHGKDERARSVGDTHEESIAALLTKAKS